ncbi:hypothetical protein AB0K52_06400 [Glycomyces sp. NPDC049804]|uniref:hypothetical protein n=1 Tax=Glycomyces sp. NPDC049804 TaxID=3154363 RepID=UPI00344A20FB
MTETDADVPAADDHTDAEPPQPARIHERATSAPEQGSVGGIQAALYVESILTVVVGALIYPLAMAFSALGGSTTADIHGLTVGFICLTAIPTSLHLLAAIQIGRARWGGRLVVGSIAVAILQLLAFVPFLFALPFLFFAAAPFIIALIAVVAGFLSLANQGLIASGSDPKRPALPEMVMVPTVLVVLVALLVGNNIVNSVENRHPAREFDSSEVGERLDSALDPLLPVLAEVEGMPDPVRQRGSDTPCNDGAGWDEEWSEYDYSYYFEDREAQVNISPNAGAGQRALEAVRVYLSTSAWEITVDEHQYPGFYRLGAVRDDGVRIRFEVGSGMTRLTAATGCVQHS